MRKRFSIWLLIFILVGIGVTAGKTLIGQAKILPDNPEDNVLVYLPIMPYTRTDDWIGPQGGLISAIAIYPQDPSIVYAGSWGGGVYKSYDGGVSWQRSSQGLANPIVVSLAVDPTNPAVVYAGTYKGKMYKSVDGGVSWFFSSAGIQEEAIVYSIVINPQITQQVFIATRGISNNNDRPWNGVVYRSDDGGASWNPKLYNLGGTDYQDWAYSLEINLSNPATLFAATHEHGPLRTLNGGESWKEINNGITNFSTRALAINPANTQIVYNGVWTKTGVFKSTDNGGSWSVKSNGIAGANIYGMAINPISPQVLYLATFNMGVVKTTNAATAWSPVGLSSIGIATVRTHPTQGQTVYAGTAGDGLYASYNAGESWTRSQNGLNATAATGLVVSPSDPGVYYAGVDGSGVLRSTDYGRTWGEFNTGLADHFINALVQRPGSSVIFALTESDGLYRCDLSNPAACWQHLSLPLAAMQGEVVLEGSAAPAADHFPWRSQDTFQDAYKGVEPSEQPLQLAASSPLLSLAFSPSAPNVAYLGTSGAGVYKSSDGGLTWQQTALTSGVVWSLAVDPLDAGLVYAATNQEGVVKISPDGGASWGNSGVAGVTFYALDTTPNQAGVVFAGTSSGSYRWVAGEWLPLGLEGQWITALRFHPAQHEWLVAGTNSGAYVSKDAGATWLPGPAELVGTTVQAIQFDPFDAMRVYYSTPANGVLRAEFSR